MGVHSGKKVSVTFKPALSGSGISFQRSDHNEEPVTAHWSNVTSTQYSTTIGHGDASIATVEHLMAALWTCGITDIHIDIDGPEVPILDGSALPWMKCLEGLGRKNIPGHCDTLTPLKPIHIQEGKGWLEIQPSNFLRVDMFVPLDSGVIQSFSYVEGHNCFRKDIADARTFSFKKNISAMLERGLIKGGSLENALVIDQGLCINELGFRQPDECARHKILDFLGDWALCAQRFTGHVVGFASGHSLNHALLKKVCEDIQSAQETTFKRQIKEHRTTDAYACQAFV